MPARCRPVRSSRGGFAALPFAVAAKVVRAYSAMIRSLPADTTAARLLAELEKATHVERMQRMVGIGRLAAARDATAARVLAELRQSDDAYARFLAIQSAFGSKDGEAVLLALRDPSRVVRRLATRLVPLACSDVQVAQAMTLVTAGAALTPLLVKLRRRGRLAGLDAGIERLLAAQPSPSGRLVDALPFASLRVVGEHLARIHGAGSPVCWKRLATHHPRLAADEFDLLLAQSQALDPRLRWKLTGIASWIAPRDPDAALGLAASLFRAGEAPSSPLVAKALRLLLPRRPAETFDLLRARHESARLASPPDGLPGIRFTSCAHRLGAKRLAYLIEHAWTSLDDGLRARRWFLRLAPEDRTAVLDAWLRCGRGAWGAFLLRHVDPEGEMGELRASAFTRWSHAARDSHGIIARPALEALPADLRVREARRHLGNVKALATKPRERVAYARFLPFDDAKVELSPWLGHPEGGERAAAISALVGCLRNDRAAIPQALELLHARKFEQDPVRRAMIGELTALPVSSFESGHLEKLGAVVRDALEAADLSLATAEAVQALLVRLFRLDAAWGATWLTKLLEVRGSVSALGMGETLTRPHVEAMAPVMRELAATWATQERAGALLWLATSFGQRLAFCEPLLDALVRLARELPFVSVAGASLGLLRRHAPRRFGDLCAELLAGDASFAVLPVVAQYLARHRQDLLDRFLADDPMTGRFASGRTHWVLAFGRGHATWTGTQQRRYAEALARLAANPKRDVPTLTFALRSLADLAYAQTHLLVSFAADPRPPVREVAIRALPRLAGGQGIPALLECLGDDRARWAIYALRRALSEIPEVRAVEILRGTPTTKVTVAKEVMRLLGEMSTPEAYRTLVAMDRPGVKRDVRIALLRALWEHLEEPDTWSIFERAAADPDWIVASRLADVPLARLSVGAEKRACELLGKVLARPEPEARLQLLQYVACLPLRDADRKLFDQCVRHFAAPHPEESVAACRAALARMLPSEVGAIVAAISALAARRPTLAALVEHVVKSVNPYTAKPVREVASGVLDHLARDPFAVGLYLRLASKILDYKELAAAFIDLSARDVLHADAMALAQSAVQACRHPERLEALLQPQRDPNLRRLALQALRSAAGSGRGWTETRRVRLQAYRADASPLVAEAAQFTFPPDEESQDAKREAAPPEVRNP